MRRRDEYKKEIERNLRRQGAQVLKEAEQLRKKMEQNHKRRRKEDERFRERLEKAEWINKFKREVEEKKHEGYMKMQDGDYESAIACLDRVLYGCKALLEFPPSEYRPEDEVLIRGMAEAWHSKGIALEKLGKHGEASKCYKKALKLYPDLVRQQEREHLEQKKAKIIAKIDETLRK